MINLNSGILMYPLKFGVHILFSGTSTFSVQVIYIYICIERFVLGLGPTLLMMFA